VIFCCEKIICELRIPYAFEIWIESWMIVVHLWISKGGFWSSRRIAYLLPLILRFHFLIASFTIFNDSCLKWTSTQWLLLSLVFGFWDFFSNLIMWVVYLWLSTVFWLHGSAVCFWTAQKCSFYLPLRESAFDMSVFPCFSLQLVEILPSTLVLFILRKLPPKRGITQYHPIR